MVKIGIIAGSGFYNIGDAHVVKKRGMSTPFGEPSDVHTIFAIGNKEVAFLPRHGSSHHIPPHKVNYRANLWGLHELGVERILSIGAVGGIKRVFKPGTIVIPDQVIDMTCGRMSSFYDGPDVIHIDFTEPYCPAMRKVLLQAGTRMGIPLINGGTYVCTNGPRLETSAEIKVFKMMGGDLVGMTGMPEAALAKELELCFTSINVVTNPAAGMGRSRLTTTEVVHTMQQTGKDLKRLIKIFLSLIPEERNCICKESLKEAKIKSD